MAITVDSITATSANCSISSKTITHTCSGSDRVLFAIVGNHTAHGTISGVTYNGVAMTKAHDYNDTSMIKGIWYLYAPDTGGAYNLTATCTVGTGCIGLGAISFNGAKQSGIPDSYSDNAGGTSTSLTGTTTTVADNCFLLMAIRAGNGLTLTGGTNTTIGSQPEVTTYGLAFAYSTAAITPAGSASLNVTSASQFLNDTMISFEQAGATTSLKTINGLAVASVKTVNGLSTASVKTVNGLA